MFVKMYELLMYYEANGDLFVVVVYLSFSVLIN